MSARGVVAALASACALHGCATATAPPATPVRAPTPAPRWFSLVPDRPGALPVIVVSVQGQSVRAVLDTGSTTSALSQELIEELALSPSGTELVRDAAGAPRKVFRYTVDVLVGPLREQLEVSPMVRTAGIDLILGRDVLDDVELYLPRGADKIALFAPGEGPREGLVRVPAELERDGLFVTLAATTPARRAVSVRMLFDTGASMSRITLADAGSAELNPDAGRAVRGAHGAFANMGALLLADARLGTARVGALLVNVDDAPGAPALLGMDALSRFDVLVSTGDGALYLGEAW